MENTIDSDEEPVEAKANQKKKGTGKKGKVFATKDSMLSLIDQVASKEENRSHNKLKRRAEIEDMAEQRELASLATKAKKQSKLEEAKEMIKNKRRIQKREKKRTIKQATESASSQKVSDRHNDYAVYLNISIKYVDELTLWADCGSSRTKVMSDVNVSHRLGPFNAQSKVNVLAFSLIWLDEARLWIKRKKKINNPGGGTDILPTISLLCFSLTLKLSRKWLP
ncbi:hypothetical protein INT43_006689 [Umbelopsis isabellina]|uniref:Uncharacterized protein n=1 Tax=Mortierella isabellina TaxID=91625 RepID=A0A8H7UFC3_MORIS|nr:hypothetical protein INT43_006689 [Umbelopsis isabellina]